jgi:hypothetical protein
MLSAIWEPGDFDGMDWIFDFGFWLVSQYERAMGLIETTTKQRISFVVGPIATAVSAFVSALGVIRALKWLEAKAKGKTTSFHTGDVVRWDLSRCG